MAIRLTIEMRHAAADLLRLDSARPTSDMTWKGGAHQRVAGFEGTVTKSRTCVHT